MLKRLSMPLISNIMAIHYALQTTAVKRVTWAPHGALNT